MKQLFGFTLVALCIIMTVSCSKHSSGPSAGYGVNSLFPLTSGDTWYYLDSTITSAGAVQAGPDTMVATSNLVTDPSSQITFVGVNNPNGWFNGSYIAVSDDNTYIYEMDVDTAGNYTYPYIFFQAVAQDQQIGYYQDITNPSCPLTEAEYAYGQPVQVAGYSTYKNIDLVQDCHQVILEEIINYVSPGVGVVRIEDYTTDTTGGANKFYEQYSQTLTGVSLKK